MDTQNKANSQKYIPAEWERHARTLLAWPCTSDWESLLEPVRDNVVALAHAIVEYEPVSLLVPAQHYQDVRSRVSAHVSLIEAPVTDVWARDICPPFGFDGEELVGFDLNFNAWGGKLDYSVDQYTAAHAISAVGARRLCVPFTSEGGALEFDGRGRLLTTRSALLNPNRNPGVREEEMTAQLKNFFGLSEVIWVDGLVGEELTDCHIDGQARFAPAGVVVLSVPGSSHGGPWAAVAHQIQRALGELGWGTVDVPDSADFRGRGEDFTPVYVNYYVCNGAVIVPQFGDKAADDRALGILKELFSERAIVGVNISAIAEGGGGIHCSTQQVPALPAS